MINLEVHLVFFLCARSIWAKSLHELNDDNSAYNADEVNSSRDKTVSFLDSPTLWHVDKLNRRIARNEESSLNPDTQARDFIDEASVSFLQKPENDDRKNYQIFPPTFPFESGNLELPKGIHKHIFAYVVPDDEETQVVQIPSEQKKQVHYKILFIKTASPQIGDVQLDASIAFPEVKTLVYVLQPAFKQPRISNLKFATTAKPSPPQVFFLKYNPHQK